MAIGFCELSHQPSDVDSFTFPCIGMRGSFTGIRTIPTSITSIRAELFDTTQLCGGILSGMAC
jgi:hypothetical protein